MGKRAFALGAIASLGLGGVGCSGPPFQCGSITCSGGDICETSCLGPAAQTCESAPAPCQLTPTCGCLVDAGLAHFGCAELDGGGVIVVNGGC
jgi:hypothetical protein